MATFKCVAFEGKGDVRRETALHFKGWMAVPIGVNFLIPYGINTNYSMRIFNDSIPQIP
jgi:hypothetical protein